MDKKIRIYSPQKARELIRSGYSLIDIEPSLKEDERINFIFKDENGEIRNLIYKN